MPDCLAHRFTDHYGPAATSFHADHQLGLHHSKGLEIGPIYFRDSSAILLLSGVSVRKLQQALRSGYHRQHLLPHS